MNVSNFLDRIKLYSQFSSIFILAGEKTNANVIYTNVDPDIIFEENELHWFDIDDNGMLDFGFQDHFFTVYSFSLQEYFTFQFLDAFRFDTVDAFAGFQDSDGTCYPYALSAGTIISESLNWQTDLTQFLATNRYDSGFPYDNCTYCNWYNESIPETLDHFLGIRFIDEVGDMHYGWIRCDVKDSGQTLVVKDYAYELEHDYPIVAGDTVHYVSIDENYLNAKIYAFGTSIFVSLSEGENNAEVKVYNMLGQIVFSGAINQQITSIPLQVEKGAYLVQITSDNKKFVKKLYIN